MLGDHGRDLRERSGLVDVLDLDAGRESLRRGVLDVPADVEPALRLLLEILQGGRLDRINRDALARRDDADDAIPGTAPPFGANFTGRSELMPRIGMATGLRGSEDFSLSLAASPS